MGGIRRMTSIYLIARSKLFKPVLALPCQYTGLADGLWGYNAGYTWVNVCGISMCRPISVQHAETSCHITAGSSFWFSTT